MTMLFWLCVGHAVADYPLQGDFLARAKNHRAPVMANGIAFPSWIALGMHALIHAGAVALVTGSVVVGCMEFVAHVAIDHATCDGRLSYGEDQFMHLLCKIAWAGVALG